MTIAPTLDTLRPLGAKVQAAETAMDEARRERDEMIRQVRRATDHTIREIAEAAGISEATVKTVIRGLR